MEGYSILEVDGGSLLVSFLSSSKSSSDRIFSSSEIEPKILQVSCYNLKTYITKAGKSGFQIQLIILNFQKNFFFLLC